MIPEISHHEAFRLFENGRYNECLDFIRNLPSRERDVPVRILEAVSLLETGHVDEGELCLRDLRVTVPESAEVCIYLGRILQDRGDDEARYFFSEAVRLDPENCEGLRWYAALLSDQEDYLSAIPVLIRLFTLSGEPPDLCRLMHEYRCSGKYSDAIQAYEQNKSPPCCRTEYLSSLSGSGADEEVIALIYQGPDILVDEGILLIQSCAKKPPDVADQIILPLIRAGCPRALVSAYIQLLLSQNRNREAAGVWSTYLSDSHIPAERILICPALISLGEEKKAEEVYQSVLFPDPPDCSMREISTWLSDYHAFLRSANLPVQGLMDQAGNTMHPSYLTCAGRCAEEEGLFESARLFYQKAFRSDIVHGGLTYAQYLAKSGDMREWEKIVLYMIRNTGKVRDIEFIASGLFSGISAHLSLLRELHAKLDRLLPLLTGTGKSLYCQAAGLLAANELTTGGYGTGVNLCLKALAEIPPYDIRTAENLFSILMACKTPGLPIRYSKGNSTDKQNKRDANPVIAGLSPGETAALQYIRRHRVCSELELRGICGTRRVAGLMNRLIRKMAAEGWHVIVKEGMSESGEVYRYAGF